MEDFNEKLVDIIQKKIVTDISKQELVRIDYNDRVNLPASFINEVYKSLDLNKIKERLKENLENEMADKIANKLITEYANDIKQIISNKELRENLRCYARDKIRGIVDSVSEVKNDY
jgi:hypothetical protein